MRVTLGDEIMATLRELFVQKGFEKFKARRESWRDKTKWFECTSRVGNSYIGPSSSDPEAVYGVETSTDWVVIPPPKLQRFAVPDLEDDETETLLKDAKNVFDDVEKFLVESLPKGRSRSQAVARLEEAFGWVIKSARVAEHARN